MSDKASVLIVEDESIIAEELRRMVVKLGYSACGVAHRYEEAVELLRRQPPDIVLLDIGLDYSENDGIDLAGHINSVHKIPFIYITANADAATVRRAKLTLPAAYITKPFNEDSVFSNIEIALHKTAFPEAHQTVVIRQGTRKIVLDVRQIAYLKADNMYTDIFTVDCKRYVVREYLKHFLGSLSAPFMVQVHRSYAVNIALMEYFDAEYVSICNEKIPVSESYRKNLLESKGEV